MLIFSKQKDLLIFPVKRSKKCSFNNFKVESKAKKNSRRSSECTLKNIIFLNATFLHIICLIEA